MKRIYQLIFFGFYILIFLGPNNSVFALSLIEISSISQQNNDTINYSFNPELFTKGDSLFELNLFNEALVEYQKTEFLPRVTSSINNQLYSFNKIGHAFRVQFEYDNAKLYFDKSKLLINKYLDIDQKIVGDTYFYLGVYFDWLNKPDSAIFYHQLAESIFLIQYGENHQKIANSLRGIGDLFRYTYYDYHTAAEYYLKALQTFESVEEDVNRRDLAMVESTLAECYRLSGDLTHAMIYVDRSIHSYKSLPNGFETSTADSYNRKANILYEMRQFDSAIQQYKKAISTTIDVKGQAFYTLITYYNNLGSAFNQKNDFGKALNIFKKSLSILIGAKRMDSMRLSDNYLHQGVAYNMLKISDSARYYLKLAYILRKQLYGFHHLETAKTLFEQSNFFRSNNLIDSALHYCQRTLKSLLPDFPSRTDYDNPDDSLLFNSPQLAKTLSLKGELLQYKFQETNNVDFLITAIRSFELTDLTIDENREKYQFDGSKLFLANETKNYYEKAIACTYQLFEFEDGLKQETTEKLYYFITRSKAILLLQQYQSINYSEVEDDLGEILIKEKELLNQTNFYEREIILNRLKMTKLQHKNNLDHSESILLKELQKRNSELETIKLHHHNQVLKLKKLIADEYPNYDRFRFNLSIVDLDQVQQYAKEKNTIVIEYFWGIDHLYYIAVKPKSYIIRKVAIDFKLISQITSFIEAVSGSYKYQNKFDKYMTFVKSSFYIFRKLFDDVLINEIELMQNLKIIPDGLLTGIPFSALTVRLGDTLNLNYRKLDYLLHSHTISYDYSSQITVSNKNKRSSNDPSILGFSYSEKNQFLSTGYGQLKELPWSFQEVRNIMSFFDGRHFAGESATECNFKKHAGNYNILHLALHGQADQNNRFNSRIIFRGDTVEGCDNILYPFELNQYELNADLVVLSACETGIGANLKGEGVYSMARGFILANCPSIVQSFWAIDDRVSTNILIDFYKNLKRAETIDLALANAKINYINNNDGLLADPMYWAGFGVVGNANSLDINIKNWNWLIYLLILITLISVIRKLRLAILLK